MLKKKDKVNALISAFGYNFMKLMRAFFVFFWLFKSLDCCIKVALVIFSPAENIWHPQLPMLDLGKIVGVSFSGTTTY